MRFQVLRALRLIEAKYSYEFGKIAQSLLAISLGPMRGGFQVMNRTTEGVDITLVRGQEKYALEVKTTLGNSVQLQEKDIHGLREMAKTDSYFPTIAALRLSLLEDWVVARADHVVPGDYTPSRLSLNSIPDLEAIARRHFDMTVLGLVEKILNPPTGSPLSYLDQVLQGESRG